MAQRHMDRLTSFDTSFLTNEKSNGHMAIGAVLVCDGDRAQPRGLRHPHPQSPPPAAPPAPAARLPAAEPGHARSGSTTPSSTSTTTCAALPLAAPGTDAQFHEVVGESFSPPLDRSQARSGSCGWSRASRTTASGSSTRPTTRWPTGSRRSTSACCSSTSSRRPSPSAARSPGIRSVPPLGRGLVGQAVRGFGSTCSRAAALAAGRPAQTQPRRQARDRRHRRALGGDLEPDQAGAEGAVQRRDRRRALLLPGPAATSASSNGSRTRSAGPSTTSPWRSPPAPCGSWLLDRELATSTGSSCRPWSRSRSAPRTSTASSATG